MARYSIWYWGDLEQLKAYVISTTIAAGLVGLVRGGIRAVEKFKKRQLTYTNAKWLYTIFKNLYGQRQPLVATLRNLEKTIEKGTNLDRAMREEIDHYRINPFFEDESPGYTREFMQKLWEEKWEHRFTYFSRFFGAVWPRKKDREYNERIKKAEKIIPQMFGFSTEGLLSTDSPIGATARYVLGVMALGKGIELALPSLDIDLGPEGEQVFSDVVNITKTIAAMMGVYKGAQNALQKYNLRIEASHQAEWLSETYARLFHN